MAMAEGERRDGLIHGPVAPDQPRDRAAVLGRDRDLQAQRARRGRHVKLPADPDEREPLPQQKAVAKVGRRRGIGGEAAAVEEAERRLSAPVADVDEHDAAAPGGVLRPKQHEGGRGLHEAVSAPRRALEVDDAGVRRVPGIEREVDDAGELLVRAGRPEGLAAEDVHARLHRHPPDLSPRTNRDQQRAGDQQRRQAAAYMTSRSHRRVPRPTRPRTRPSIPNTRPALAQRKISREVTSSTWKPCWPELIHWVASP